MPKKPRKRPRNPSRRQPDPQRCGFCLALRRQCQDRSCCPNCTHNQEGTV